jgi:hypothetical protein
VQPFDLGMEPASHVVQDRGDVAAEHAVRCGDPGGDRRLVLPVAGEVHPPSVL